MLQGLKDFQLQRLTDFTTLTAIAQRAWEERQLPKLDAVPHSAFYTAIGTLVAAQLVMVLLTRRGRHIIFLTVDTAGCFIASVTSHAPATGPPWSRPIQVLAVLLVLILLVAILSLPIGAVYIGIRGSVMMARSLSDNFPVLGLVLRPLLAALGQAAAAPVAAAGSATAATGGSL
ncbi:hypothetical protein VOLCADRAFT_88713 [Volvox carteri f. nagariensis]|uniref:Uncharacterized protein n=1 Tax=Volvox carteri f. nagariensis TaxID=3068 RepID=D8TPR7_VOLCA|nr:uncharacterized protein VOLCADRAFT_88713 [Volvox carteri f. nagariensis]EFJ50663.1 hypothetical protein VOLCADRAFT_88713 [Volvox carteri f. nagariensis]|eukprot:XP_002948256.1 hypothetical protein VOLCADRAFT_88713 [Volvox carteri f. nagariensis]